MMIVDQLRAYEPPAAQWAMWKQHEPGLALYDFALLRLTLMDRSVPPSQKDELLGALIRLGQDTMFSESRTATIVLLLPGLRHVAVRYQHALGSQDTWAELIAATWELLGRYDLERRPNRVAANILWDGCSVLSRSVRRERVWLDRIELDDCRDDGDRPHAVDDAEILQPAVAARILTPLDATLITATRLSGLRLNDAALMLGLSYEAAKKRRRRAEVAWLSWWLASNQSTPESKRAIAA